MFAEDADFFLADFGSPTTWAPANGQERVGLMVLDQPGQAIDGGDVQSNEYQCTYATSQWPGLRRGHELRIDGPEGQGRTFRLRHDPRANEDGVFSTAALTKL